MSDDADLPLFRAAEISERRAGIQPVSPPPVQHAPAKPKAKKPKPRVAAVEPTAADVVVPFPLAFTKRVHSIGKQVLSCRPENRGRRFGQLLEMERTRLTELGIEPGVIEREVTALHDRVQFMLAARPLQWDDAG